MRFASWPTVLSAVLVMTVMLQASAVASFEPADGGRPVLVEAVNASRSTRCAEEDNIYVHLQAPAIERFRITALPPAYLAQITADSTAPDFSNCDMSGDPSFAFTPKTVTLYEDEDVALIGHTFARFWRPERVPVTVGGATTDGLHLLQVFRSTGGRRVEVLVLYPADGYWRVKTLPPSHLPDTAYGSSFLIGPIDEDGRPFVALREVTFEPAMLTFRLGFARGGAVTLRVDEAGADRVGLDIRFEPPIGVARPFAALRSMYVTPQVADVSEAAWQPTPGAGWQTQAIAGFAGGAVSSIRFGRTAISRHNTSAPDLLFDGFRRGD